MSQARCLLLEGFVELQSEENDTGGLSWEQEECGGFGVRGGCGLCYVVLILFLFVLLIPASLNKYSVYILLSDSITLSFSLLFPCLVSLSLTLCLCLSVCLSVCLSWTTIYLVNDSCPAKDS